MARDKLKKATDQRNFTIVYNDFLESDLLNYYEKIVFICLKKFADSDSLTAFPSLNTLHRMTGISRSKIQDSISSMKEKGVLRVQRRESNRGHRSNLYTLYDYAEIWGIGKEDAGSHESIAEDISEAKMVAELRKRGYTVTKEKELPSATLAGTDESSTHLNHSVADNDKGSLPQSQDEERYTMPELRAYFGYEALADLDQADVDAVFNVLYDTLNTKKKSIRVGGEDRPAKVVVSKLMKLTYDDIRFVIAKYNEQRGRIKNPVAYILTQLYGAKEQNHLDLKNQGHHAGDF